MDTEEKVALAGVLLSVSILLVYIVVFVGFIYTAIHFLKKAW